MNNLVKKYSAIVFFLIYASLYFISCGNNCDKVTSIKADVSSITLIAVPEVHDNGDETLSLVISAQVQDQSGNPIPDNTVIFFNLIDRVLVNASDGQTNGTNIFTAVGKDFLSSGVVQGDILVVLDGQDEGGHIIVGVTSNYLILDHDLVGSEDNIGFAAGRQEIGSICGIAWTGHAEPDETCTPVSGTIIRGTAYTRITYNRSGIWQPFYVYAESEDGAIRSVYVDEYVPVRPVTLDVSFSKNPINTEPVIIYAHLYDGANHGIGGQWLTSSICPDNIGTYIKNYPVITSSDGTASDPKWFFFDIAAGTVPVQVKVSCDNGRCCGAAILTVITSDPPPFLPSLPPCSGCP